MNREIGRVYLAAADPAALTRTWQQVMDEIILSKTGKTLVRWQSAVRPATVVNTSASFCCAINHFINAASAAWPCGVVSRIARAVSTPCTSASFTFRFWTPQLSGVANRCLRKYAKSSWSTRFSREDLFALLGHELEARITTKHGSPEFVTEIQALPVGLRAMAATFELDVSLALDDLGWHFGNWHNIELSIETIKGLQGLGAPELGEVFQAAIQLAQDYWTELGSED